MSDNKFSDEKLSDNNLSENEKTGENLEGLSEDVNSEVKENSEVKAEIQNFNKMQSPDTASKKYKGAAREITRKKTATTKAIIASVFIVFGAILQFFLKSQFHWEKTIYDLGYILMTIGGIILLKAMMDMISWVRNRAIVLHSKEKIRQSLLNNAIFLVLGILIVVIIFIKPNFMQIRVMHSILSQASTKLILALGVCFTLLIAGTDLSAGRMVGLSAVIASSMLQKFTYAGKFYPDLQPLPLIVPILLAILACMAFGLLNGFLVAKFDMHPFIATLAVQVIVYGTVSLYFDMPPNNSQPLGGFRNDFTALGENMGNSKISILIPIAILVTIIVWFILNKTNFGKNVYAIGGNREAAVVSGINVFRTVIIIFVFASALYGIAGVLEAARTSGATNNYGMGYELDAIAACVVGGVSLNGGVGTVSGIISGVLIFQVIQVGLQFISISPMWQQIIRGLIIAVAVAIDMAKYKRK